MNRRIGIFSGTFDPIHKGHISFALQATTVAKLDAVYFMPEAKPRRKEGVTHYAHRQAMLEMALKPYPKLRTLEVPDRQFSVTNTMPRLKNMFKGDQLLMLMGSDTVDYLFDAVQWPNSKHLFKDLGFIIGLRGKADETALKSRLVPIMKELFIVTTENKNASSSKIRQAAGENIHHKDALKSTKTYMKNNWLYDSLGSAKRS